MKFIIPVLTVLAAFAAPAGAQVLVGPGVLNGDFEEAELTPFAPPGGTRSTVQALSGGASLEIDLTANNFEGQWKSLFFQTGPNGNGPEFDVVAGQTIEGSVQIYIPQDTRFGFDEATNGNTNSLIYNLEFFTPDDPADPDGAGVWASVTGSFFLVDLTSAEDDVDGTEGIPINRDEWRPTFFPDVVVPSGAIRVRLRGVSINTASIVNMKKTFTNGTADEEIAAPSDWMSAGYIGSFFIDDFSLVIREEVDTGGLIVSGDLRNGNFEASTLVPFTNPGSSITTLQNNTPGGTQALRIDLAEPDSNEFTPIFTQTKPVSGTVNEGDLIVASVWAYIPGEGSPDFAVFGPEDSEVGVLALNIRSDNTPGATGTLGAGLFTNLVTAPRDEWFQLTVERVAENGVSDISSVNTSGFFLQTAPITGTESGYSGAIYLDDFEFRAETPQQRRVVFGPDSNNGDLENAELTPFQNGTIVEGRSQTPGDNQALQIDLQANNQNAQWKPLVSGVSAPIVAPGSTLEISAWVFVPADTRFGPAGATVNLTASTTPGVGAAPDGQMGTPTLNLAVADFPRDEWVQLSSTITLSANESGVEPTSVAFNNWNFRTDDFLGDSNTIDATMATRQDWADEGYEGFVFLDDFSVVLQAPDASLSPEIVITSTTYSPTEGLTIEFSNPTGVADLVLFRSDGSLDLDDFNDIGGIDNGATSVVDPDAVNVDSAYYIIDTEDFAGK